MIPGAKGYEDSHACTGEVEITLQTLRSLIKGLNKNIGIKQRDNAKWNV